MDVFPPRPAEDAEDAAAEAARRLFAQDCRFAAAAATPAAMPPDDLPEIAFVGRSNVGKSSLINAVTARRRLARTSNTPGRTRQINFFELGRRLVLVDLPGYGYADASKAMIADWTLLVRRYLAHRAALRRVCLLVDSRHGIKDIDRPLMRMLDEAAVSWQVVLTKTDKPAPGDLPRLAAAVAGDIAAHPAAHPEIHLTSAEKGLGIAALRTALAAFAGPAPVRAMAPLRAR